MLVGGLALVALFSVDAVGRINNGDVIVADEGDVGTPVDPKVPADSYPGKEDGFVRGTDKDGNEAYSYEYQNQVYVVPAEDYYQWRGEYYHDEYHGGLTSVMLHALLISHLFHATAYSPSYFHNSYHFGPPVGAYYASPAYSSHYGPPTMQNGRVVHGGSPTTTRTGTPVARGTPVAQARPVATARPVANGAAVGAAAVATARPVATATPVAAAKPAAAATPARPVARPTSRGWATARSAHRSSYHFSCFAADASVTRPNGSASRIDSLQVGDVVSGWATAAAALSGAPASPMRVAKVERFEAHAPLRGLQMTLPDAQRLTLPPFVTTNHALLGADGAWSAIDEDLAASELEHYLTNTSIAVPKIGKLAPGSQLLLTVPETTGEAAGKAAPLVKSTLEAIIGADGAADNAAGAAAARREVEAVYSLELEAASLAVYIVNGVLAMD